ncbi:MAG TPA: CBS domain-containing protein [Xanthobacteraceae bacterium]|jgi:CBS domain-containing protein
MKASDVMTPHILSVSPDESVFVAARLMLQKKISGLPVVDAGGNLVGMVTEGDFLRRTETDTKRRRPKWLEFFVGPGRLADEYVRFSGRKVRDVMTRDVRTVTPDASLEDVVRIMERHNIKRVPVVEQDKVVGIITRANLLHAMASYAHEIAPSSAEDTTIRDRFFAELENQPWAPITAVDVAVRNGVVRLSGIITDERQRQALRVAAENIPGVKKVEDFVVWVEPVSGIFAEAPPQHDEDGDDGAQKISSAESRGHQ